LPNRREFGQATGENFMSIDLVAYVEDELIERGVEGFVEGERELDYS